jgi:hypothetical protein
MLEMLVESPFNNLTQLLAQEYINEEISRCYAALISLYKLTITANLFPL